MMNFIAGRTTFSLVHSAMALQLFPILLSSWLTTSPVVVVGELLVPGLLDREYPFSFVREADVNIGLIVGIHQMSEKGQCSDLNPSGVMWSQTMQFALKKVNERNDLLPNITIGFVQMDDCSEPLKALEVSIYFVKDGSSCPALNCSISKSSDERGFQSYDVIGVLGPEGSGTSVTIAPYLGTFDIPLMALYATANALSDKTKYPFFVRLVPAETGQELTILEVMRMMNWTYVSMVNSADAYGDGAAADIQNLLRTHPEYGVCLAAIVRIPPAAVGDNYDDIVSKLVAITEARVVLLYVSSYDFPGFFKSVRGRVGLGWFTFIGGDGLNSQEQAEYVDLLEGSIYTDMPSVPIPGFQQYIWSLDYSQSEEDKWLRELWHHEFPCLIAGASNTCRPKSQSLNQSDVFFAWPTLSRIYDGVFVYANALHNLIASTCPEAFIKSPQQSTILNTCVDGDTWLKYLKNTTITGIIGKISFDATGDMIGDIEVHQYQSHWNTDGTKSYVGVKAGISDQSVGSTTAVQLQQLIWPSSDKNNGSLSMKPESTCSVPCRTGEYAVLLAIVCCWRCEPCPSDGDLTGVGVPIKYSLCQKTVVTPASTLYVPLIAGCVVTAFVVLLAIVSALIIRSKRADAKVWQMLWKVNFSDVSLIHTMANRSLKETNHDNIRSFIGACIEPGNVCYLMQFCSRRTIQGANANHKYHMSTDQELRIQREEKMQLEDKSPSKLSDSSNSPSLEDIVEDDNIKLDWLFRLSLIIDAVNGMIYLHKSVFQSHGHLSSAQCYVDSRWVLKIGGFSLHAFRDDKDINVVGEYVYYRDLLWTAPELLRMQERPINGTQKGDVYSFAIILQEIAYRAQPYFCDKFEPKMIIKRLCDVETPVFRPEHPVDNIDHEMPPTVEMVMQRCWSEKPSDRPSFEEVVKLIKSINKGKKVDIVDNMLQRLEKYADNLENLVQQRTAELEDEKLKTDRLLNRMLPPFVANELKAGRIVKPQMFASATIYFSDIVGFTNLSSESTPFEVVDLLNDLYNTFDDTISRHDVYKVETIGDAYMVVSGLPRPNEGRHIVEICNMALDLLDEVSRFKIRHRPEQKLMLRIGIHTGSCAAGVVGHAMPRYCLFGDTVNTASRMESTGEALRIHLSEDAKREIVNFSGFNVELRGQTFVKGKGMLSTYWLHTTKTSIPRIIESDDLEVENL